MFLPSLVTGWIHADDPVYVSARCSLAGIIVGVSSASDKRDDLIDWIGLDGVSNDMSSILVRLSIFS